MRPLFEHTPDIPTLLIRIINVTHRLALKLDAENSDEYYVYMNNGFWSNYGRMDIAEEFTSLREDEEYDNLPDFHANMVSQVLSILLRFESAQMANTIITPNMLIYYLREGRYPHESITDRIYYDRPLIAADAEKGRYEQIRNIIDVLAILMWNHLSQEEATYQFRYLVTGAGKVGEDAFPQLEDCISAMKHRDEDRALWELSQM